MTSFAIGEAEALVLKAYRGAGYSWGLAQEAGRAAGWLGERSLPAIDLFAALLQQIAELPYEQLVPVSITHRDATKPEPAVHWYGSGGVLCPVASGALISDLGAEFLHKHQRLTLASVSAPAILLPFVVALELPLTFRVDDIEIGSPDNVNESVVWQRILDMAQLACGTVEISLVSTASPIPWQRPAVRTGGTAESIALLQRLAHRTYVPATRESREAGAGAGLSDND